MKNSICCFLLLLFVKPNLALAVPFQDLDRVNQIVDQARNMAAAARHINSTPASQVADSFHNPFANNLQKIGPAGIEETTASRVPAVDIDESNIRINTGGNQFVIPRINAGAPIAGPTTAALPSLRMGVDLNAQLANVEAYRRYSDALSSFRDSNFQGAAKEVDTILLPAQQAHAISPFRSLCFFATGHYKKSAAYAYTAAAKTQVWSWQQLRNYYGDANAYSQQYQALQELAQQKANSDASILFLTGYHHLMLGHREHAAREFSRVLQLLPNDPVTSSLLKIARQSPPMPAN